MNDLSIIVVHYQTPKLTQECLKSIFSRDWDISLEVFVVDNSSDQAFEKQIKQLYPKVKILDSGKNLGFSKGNNLALKVTGSKYCLLLNSDTKLTDHCLDRLLGFAAQGAYDIASCKLLNQDSSWQPNAGDLPDLFSVSVWLSGLDDILKNKILVPSYQQRDRRYYQKDGPVGWVSGSVMLINSQLFTAIGYLDEEIFMYGEDVEFCLRAERAGFKVGWTDKAKIYHFGGGSSATPLLHQWLGEFKGLLYIFRKYYGSFWQVWLKILIYFFISLRAITFLFLGKVEYTKTYVKILRLL